jgi:hypothetical protein
MSEPDEWYVVKRDTGVCEIIPASQLAAPSTPSDAAAESQWGPYPSRADAIARRVGLIRAGKCQPL